MGLEIVNYDYNFVTNVINLINKGELPSPFSREIFLIDVHIAGTSYIDLSEIEPELLPGEIIFLKRETENKYDNLAIIILDKKGRKIGYVPRDKNEVLARLMDAGKMIFGKIITKNYIDNWLKIDVEIFLKEI